MDVLTAQAENLTHALWFVAGVGTVVRSTTLLILVVLCFVPGVERRAIKTLEIVAGPSGPKLIRWQVGLSHIVVSPVLLPLLTVLALRKSTGGQARRVMVILYGRSTGKLQQA